MTVVTVKGADRLAATTAKAGAALSSLPRSVHEQAGQILAGAARRAAPHRTGYLARSIRVRSTGTGATVSAAARYARFVSYGSRHNPRPVPFMDVGLDRGQADAVDVYAAAVDNIVGSIRGA